jgi:glycosyltransferase involved in cell wall biosynthesis
MSAGCAIVASNTQPLHEAIQHDDTGRLVGFFDAAGITDELCTLLDDQALRERLGASARTFAREQYDLRMVCLPRQLAWVSCLADS